MIKRFKVGDRVKRIDNEFKNMKPGDTDTINGITETDLSLKKYGWGHAEHNFVFEPKIEKWEGLI